MSDYQFRTDELLSRRSAQTSSIRQRATDSMTRSLGQIGELGFRAADAQRQDRALEQRAMESRSRILSDEIRRQETVKRMQLLDGVEAVRSRQLANQQMELQVRAARLQLEREEGGQKNRSDQLAMMLNAPEMLIAGDEETGYKKINFATGEYDLDPSAEEIAQYKRIIQERQQRYAPRTSSGGGIDATRDAYRSVLDRVEAATKEGGRIPPELLAEKRSLEGRLGVGPAPEIGAGGATHVRRLAAELGVGEAELSQALQEAFRASAWAGTWDEFLVDIVSRAIRGDEDALGTIRRALEAR